MKSPSADAAAELSRDIAAARAELRGRCDQLVAELEERVAALEALLQQVESGAVDVRGAQARVRQLVSERSNVTTAARAGRTTIGMSVPQPKAAAPGGPQRMTPTPTLAEAAVTRSIQAVDLRIVAILARARALPERAEARLELSLLLRMRKSLERHATEKPPADAVLLAAIMESIDEVGIVLADLDGTGAPRCKRLVEHARELVSELLALGGSAAPLKEQVQRAKKLLASPAPGAEKQAMSEALAAFAKLQQELDRRYPLASPAWLDDLLKA